MSHNFCKHGHTSCTVNSKTSGCHRAPEDLGLPDNKSMPAIRVWTINMWSGHVTGSVGVVQMKDLET